jgi:predicted P-loop ATPase
MNKPIKEPERADSIEQEQKTESHQKKSKQQDIESWLNRFYQFRYNTIKQKPEFKLFEINSKWKPIDKYKLLTIKRELDSAGLTISKDGLMDILCSNFSVAINPVKDYFQNLEDYIITEPDYIDQLCSTIKCKNAVDWKLYLKKWLVSVVANVFIEDKCANHTMLVLTGDQGKFKTTWLENLCPPELKSYNYTGKLNLESKDCLTYLAEYLFVNIDDQLKQLHKKDENELKNLITINFVKYRKPYDPIITEYPHLCSFLASVNGNDFLSDPTGSRRFLPFEVENIDIEKAKNLDINLIWKQAKFLFKTNFRYWFNSDEIDYLNQRNESFSMVSAEEELINFYYRSKPVSLKESLAPETIKFLTPTMILVDLELKTKQRLNKKKLGEALTKLKFIKKQRTIENRIQWTWQIIEKSTEAREKETNLIEETEINF